MWWPVTPYSVVLVLSLAAAAGTAVVAWRTRPAAGARSLTAVQAAVAVWLGAHVLEIESSAFATKLLWVDVQWVAAAVIPTCFLVFALEYTGSDRWLSRRWLALLALEPLAMIALLGRKRLLWEAPYEETVAVGASWAPPATVTTAAPNAGLLFHLGYATLCLGVASMLVLGVVVRNDRLYRWQALAVLVSIAVPWATAVLSISSLETIGTTPIGFTITGFAITFGLYRYRLLDLTPIARHEVVENLTDGVLVVDDHRRVVDCNPAARELFGPDRESLVGVPIGDCLPAGIDIDALVDADAQAPADGGSCAQFAAGAGDERRHYALSASPIDGGRGRPAGWTVVVHDVTDRVRRERDLERANRKLDEFATVVSHDLRNPLSVSQGYLDLLEAEYDPEYVRKIATAQDRMEHLIDDVLALARQGRDALDPEPVGLEAASRGAWETVETAGATLVVADDRTIRADPAQFRQLLENLFRNAVEHGSTSPDSQTRRDTERRSASFEPSVADAPEDAVEHGSTTPPSAAQRDPDSAEYRSPTLEAPEDRRPDGESITVTVGALEDGLYVEDTGRGFEDGTDRLFEAGYTTGEHGTGLGLAIVADVVDHHGWSITATDADGGGARFEITGVEFREAADATTAP